MTTPWWAWAALAVGVILNATANILIKAGMRTPGLDLWSRLTGQPWLLLGLACFGLALIGYSAALSRIPLTVGYPIMTGAGMAIVAIGSHQYFGEGISLTIVVGMVLIVVGLGLILRG